MEWNNTKDKLPPHGVLVLGWGRNHNSGYLGFHICGMDYEQGWCEWPDGHTGLEIFHWAEIQGPKGEKEPLFIIPKEEADEMD